MSTKTTNLEMTVLEASDTGVVDVMNSNFTKVDEEIGTLNENLVNKYIF